VAKAEMEKLTGFADLATLEILSDLRRLSEVTTWISKKRGTTLSSVLSPTYASFLASFADWIFLGYAGRDIRKIRADFPNRIPTFD
jgi:hypothetical protein